MLSLIIWGNLIDMHVTRSVLIHMLPSNTYTEWQSHVLISAEKQRFATWNDVCRKWIDTLPAVPGWTLNFWGEMGTPCNSEGIKNRHSNVLNSALYRCSVRLYFFLLYISGRYIVSSTRSSQIYEKISIYFLQSMLHTLVFWFWKRFMEPQCCQQVDASHFYLWSGLRDAWHLWCSATWVVEGRERHGIFLVGNQKSDMFGYRTREVGVQDLSANADVVVVFALFRD